jgi:hypothetical protein
MQELTHYIGGQHVKGKSGRFADVMNPATGEVQLRTMKWPKPSQSRRKRKSTGPRPIRKSVPGF